MFVNKIKTLPTFKNNCDVKCECEKVKEKDKPKKANENHKLDIIA